MEMVPPSDAEPKAGQFLLSEPFLLDPWFGRKVLFLCNHDDEGSMGFVLDNGMQRNLTSLLPDAESWSVEQEVHRGGPIHADSLFYLHRFGDRVEESIPVLPGLWMGGDFDALKEILNAEPAGPADVRFFAGYSGWAPGQLKDEMEGSSWYVHDLPAPEKMNVVMDSSSKGLWAKLLSSKGPGFAKVTQLPQDPSLN